MSTPYVSDDILGIFVLIFLLITYLLKTKTNLSDQTQLFIYWPLLLMIGCREAIKQKERLNFQIITLYLCLAFFGSILWNILANRFIRNLDLQK